MTEGKQKSKVLCEQGKKLGECDRQVKYRNQTTEEAASWKHLNHDTVILRIGWWVKGEVRKPERNQKHKAGTGRLAVHKVNTVDFKSKLLMWVSVDVLCLLRKRYQNGDPFNNVDLSWNSGSVLLLISILMTHNKI